MTTATKTEAPAEFDVHADYAVYSLNPEYAGSANHVVFRNGEARLYGLPKDATEEEKQARIELFAWFKNAGEGKYFYEHVVDEATGKTERAVKTGPVYSFKKIGG